MIVMKKRLDENKLLRSLHYHTTAYGSLESDTFLSRVLQLLALALWSLSLSLEGINATRG